MNAYSAAMQDALALKGRWGVAAGVLEAAKNGQTDAMRCLARIGEGAAAANGSHGFDDNRTPLHYAARNNHCDTVMALVNELGAPVNAADADGRTPLHWAAAEGHIDVMRVLVKELGADPNVMCARNQTPLSRSLSNDHHEAVRVLVKELGASITLGKPIKSEGGSHVGFEESDLEEAARTGNDDIFCLIAEAAGAEGVRAERRYGLTAMHYAARWCGPPSLRSLAALGVDVNAPCSKKRQFPLHLAALRGRGLAPVVGLLVGELGADVDAKDATGGTPLHTAAELLNRDAIRQLLASGATVDVVDSNGETPLLRILMSDASVLEEVGIMRVLLDNGADVRLGDPSALDDVVAAEQRHSSNVSSREPLFDSDEEEREVPPPFVRKSMFLVNELCLQANHQ